MLVVTINIGKQLHIGDDVKLKVRGIKGSHVSFGIDADEAIPIHRKEVIEREATACKIAPSTATTNQNRPTLSIRDK